MIQSRARAAPRKLSYATIFSCLARLEHPAWPEDGRRWLPYSETIAGVASGVRPGHVRSEGPPDATETPQDAGPPGRGSSSHGRLIKTRGPETGLGSRGRDSPLTVVGSGRPSV